MFKQSVIVAMLAGVIALAPALSNAAEPAQAKARPQAEKVYGSQLMTAQERSEYRAKMRGLKTTEERDALRAEHHKLMQERATSQGKALPTEVPPVGAGQGGMGAGGGMGQGAGMGGGRNR